MSRELILIPKHKYKSLLDKSHSVEELGLEQEKSVDQVVVQDNMNEDLADSFLEMIKYSVPKTMVRKAEGLYILLKGKDSDIISWTDNGELKIRGETIPNTNIVDLVKYVVSLKAKFPPNGHKEFYKVLKEMHIPSAFIMNERVRTVDKQSTTVDKNPAIQTGSGNMYVNGPLREGLPGYTTNKKKKRWTPY